MLYNKKIIIQAANSFRKIYSGRIDLGVVLGSGLSEMFNEYEVIKEFEFTKIKHLKTTGVSGHRNRFILLRLEGKTILAMQGRPHLYEGYSAFEVSLPVAVMGEMGTKELVLTNAAGGIDPDFQPGDIMAITGHINLQGTSPLFGMSGASKFVDMTNAYDRSLLPELQKRFQLKSGIYAGVLGPNYETPDEIKYLRTIGASAVGMSTIMEDIMAKFYGMRVFGFSMIANKAAGMAESLSHTEVLEAGKNASVRLMEIVRYIAGKNFD
jgi:purine-nucleoside phosphorylase